MSGRNNTKCRILTSARRAEDDVRAAVAAVRVVYDVLHSQLLLRIEIAIYWQKTVLRGRCRSSCINHSSRGVLDGIEVLQQRGGELLETLVADAQHHARESELHSAGRAGDILRVKTSIKLEHHSIVLDAMRVATVLEHSLLLSISIIAAAAQSDQHAVTFEYTGPLLGQPGHSQC